MQTAKLQSKYLTLNGLRFHYLDWGNEGMKPLICLHSHTANAHIWDEFAEFMSPYYNVLAIDQRGHGETEWADTGYARDKFVADLTEFVDALGLRRFTLIGGSMGGWNALLYAAENPDRVESIILVDIAPEPSAIHLDQMSTRELTPTEFITFDAALYWMQSRNPWASEDRIRKDTEDKIRQREDGKWTWKADPALFNTVLPDMTDATMIERYWRALEAIPCPIMEVRGTKSSLVDDDIVQRMKQTGKQITSVDIPGAGHVVSVDKPQEFIKSTCTFLGIPV